MPQFLKKFQERESIIMLAALVAFLCQRFGVIVDHDQTTKIAANLVELGTFVAYIWSRTHVKTTEIAAGSAIAQQEIITEATQGSASFAGAH